MPVKRTELSLVHIDSTQTTETETEPITALPAPDLNAQSKQNEKRRQPKEIKKIAEHVTVPKAQGDSLHSDGGDDNDTDRPNGHASPMTRIPAQLDHVDPVLPPAINNAKNVKALQEEKIEGKLEARIDAFKSLERQKNKRRNSRSSLTTFSDSSTHSNPHPLPSLSPFPTAVAPSS